jgi:hypothetical protein
MDNQEKSDTTTNIDENLENLEIEKAITFLLSKELKDKSLIEKKDFLKKKLNEKSLEKAMKIYPILDRILETETKKIEAENKIEPFKYLKELGLYSTLIITTLGVNYLLDLSRNKRFHLANKELETRINQELIKTSEKITEDIKKELKDYLPINKFEEKYKESYENTSKIMKLHPNKNSNILLKQIEGENKINTDKINEMKNKIETLKITMTKEIKDDCSKLINKLTNEFLNKFETKIEPKTEIKHSNQEENAIIESSLTVETKEGENEDEIIFKNIIDNVDEEAKSSFFSVLTMQINKIIESNEEKGQTININNMVYKKLKNNENLSRLLINIGFVKSSEFLYVLDNKSLLKEKQENIIKLIESYS